MQRQRDITHHFPGHTIPTAGGDSQSIDPARKSDEKTYIVRLPIMEIDRFEEGIVSGVEGTTGFVEFVREDELIVLLVESSSSHNVRRRILVDQSSEAGNHRDLSKRLSICYAQKDERERNLLGQKSWFRRR